MHDGHLDGLLGHWVVERGCFCGVDGALHCAVGGSGWWRMGGGGCGGGGGGGRR